MPPPRSKSPHTTTASVNASTRILRRGSPLTRTSTPTWLGNPNVDWLHFRGTWLTNLLIAITLRLLFATVPGLSNEAAWTLTNLTYNIFAFFFFHWLCGTPFDIHQNEYGALTFWEQIDEGAQYTPTRKFLIAFPVFLFLLSTHYSRYDLGMFCANVAVLTVQLIPKMPFMHRVRLFGINKKPN